MTEWITDREPVTSGVYLVTILDRSSNIVSRDVDIDAYDLDYGWDNSYKVLAWMELPDPYDGEIKEEYIPASWISNWIHTHASNLSLSMNVKDMMLDWRKENGN